ncbi:MAG: phosphate transport system protein [Methanothermococcus sp.]|nr:phosphate transport system protein [Methanothermococcus sp.]
MGGKVPREAFLKKIQKIEDNVLDMSILCLGILRKSTVAFLNSDKKLAKEVIKCDSSLDKKVRELEEKCVSIIALQQPVATDLKTVMTIIKIISKLEIIGNYTIKIAQITLKSKSNIKRDNKLLNLMMEKIEAMSIDSLIAFKTGNEKLAMDVHERNKEIKELCYEIYMDMVNLSMQSPEKCINCRELILTAKYLEGCGDIIALGLEST